MNSILTIIGVFLFDFSTKFLVTQSMSYGASTKVTPFFNIVHVKNLGVSFSLLYNNHKLGPWILGLISVFITSFVLRLLQKTSNVKSKIALAAVIGGALGNLFDRFKFGGVIDFLDFHIFDYHWPAFNIADMAIVLGLGTYWFLERK
jgi:signal peptidase II